MLIHILKKASEHIGARVHPAIKRIIQAEVKARHLADDTDFLKIAILSCAVSEESRRIMREEMLDPMMHAMMIALGISLPASRIETAPSSLNAADSAGHTAMPSAAELAVLERALTEEKSADYRKSSPRASAAKPRSKSTRNS
jgi:hypothetical protein